jgi:hypothetical protein
MKVWCVACFNRLVARSIRGELSKVYVFSSLQGANNFLQTKYIDYNYDDYEIYESDIDGVD